MIENNLHNNLIQLSKDSNGKIIFEKIEYLKKHNFNLEINEIVEFSEKEKQIEEVKEELLQEVFNFLAVTLGLPPQNFEFAFRNKDNEYKKFVGSPKEFYNKYVGIDLNKCLKKRIIQDYLYWDKLSIVRVRCIESDVVKKFVYTVKTGKKVFLLMSLKMRFLKDYIMN